MNYQTLLNQLKRSGYTFEERYGQLHSATSEPPLLEITHRYPGRKADTIQRSKGYITRLDLPGSPDDTLLYWCTNFYMENGTRVPIGSDWSQLRHILSCKPVKE